MTKHNTQIAVASKVRRVGAAAGRLAHDRRGATIVEYLVIVGLVALAAIALFTGPFFGSITAAVGGQAGQIGGLGN